MNQLGQNKPLRLLTYNLFMRPPPIKTNQDDFKNQRCADIINNVLPNYDIICFQQLFQTANFRSQKMVQAAIKKGFYYWKMSQPPAFYQGPPVDSGLLVISRFPILYSKFQSYKLGILSDSASDKAYIYCKISVKGDIIHLFNTHLQASYISDNPATFSYTVLTRLTQIRYLRQCINSILQQQKYKKQDLVLLTGDLNIDSRRKTPSVHNVKLLDKYLPQFQNSQERHFVGIIKNQSQYRNNKKQSIQLSKQKQLQFQPRKKRQLEFSLKENPSLNQKQQKIVIEPIEQQQVNKHKDNIHSQLLHRQYFLIKNIFSEHNFYLKDLILEKDKVDHINVQNHPFTFGEDDTVLTDKTQINSYQRLDYIFQVIKNDKKSNSTIKPINKSCVVNKFKVNSRQYTQLSDHYGVQVLLKK